MEQERHYAGLLSRKDIEEELLYNEVSIFPFAESNLTDLGYNLSPSDFVFSTQKGILLEIHETETERYVWVPGCDTVLILSREYVSVSNRIAGTFHSRVRVVSQGFGHVSTTLDPGWSGPLLFAINNPSSHRKKFVLGSNSGKGMERVTFITMMLQYLNTYPDHSKSDNKAFRLDILSQYYNKPGVSKRKFNKSFILLDEIIQMTTDMSPDQPNAQIPTVEIDQLEDFVIDCLDFYAREENHRELLARLKKLKYGFNQLRKNSSLCLHRQIEAVLEVCNQQQPIQMLIDRLESLAGGCEIEKCAVRWEVYTKQLGRKLQQYHVGKWMQFSLLLHRNWLVYISITLVGIVASSCVLVYFQQQSLDSVAARFLVAIIPALITGVFSISVSRSLKK